VQGEIGTEGGVKIVLVLRRRPRPRKAFFFRQRTREKGPCSSPKQLDGESHRAAQRTVEDNDEYENEHESGLIREGLSLLLLLRHNGQTAKEHPTVGSNTE
jgi:hypothetical protein